LEKKVFEKLVKFNGIPLSKTGFRNIIFDTSRYAKGLDSIRGFGETMSEMNLSNIETINIHFVLKTDELSELAYIYSLFRTQGVLPVENEYLMDKISSSLKNSLTEERLIFNDKLIKKINGDGEINSNSPLRKNISCLCMILENMSIKNKIETSDGYDISMNLSLYKNSFDEKELEQYLKIFEEWKRQVNFDVIKEEISNCVSKLKNTSVGISLNYYNSNSLNAIYKNNILASTFKSFRLKEEADINKKIRTDNQSDNAEKEKNMSGIGISKEDLDNQELIATKLDEITEKIKIPNSNIIEIELITNNNIAYIPIKGSSILEKSILGIGKTNFSVKLLFDEKEEKTIVQKLKTISDKNIINHKLEIDHPLIQLFDFHSGNIINMNFNSLENQHGIIVTMVFSINGYRFSQEAFINNNDNLGDVLFQRKASTNNITGSYLETLNNYLNINIIEFKGSWDLFNSFEKKCVPSIVNLSKAVKNIIKESKLESAPDIRWLDLISSYSTIFTNYNNILYNVRNKQLKNNAINDFINLSKMPVKNFQSDLHFYLLGEKLPKQLLVNDFKVFYNPMNVFDGAVWLTDKLKYNESFIKNIASDEEINIYFIQDVARRISLEMFNHKLNNQKNEIELKVIRKFFEEYLIRLGQISYKVFFEYKTKENLIFINKTINYKRIFSIIEEKIELLFNMFINTFNDERFINRIIKEIYYNELNKDIDYIKNLVKDYYSELKDFWKNNKKDIAYQMYNVFLLKLTYYSIIETNEYDGDSYLKKNEKLNLILYGVCLSLPLFLKISDRTDMFYHACNVTFDLLGTVLNLYNYDLDNENKMFWESEYIKKEGNKEVFNSFCKYLNETDYSMINSNIGQTINMLSKKDNDYLYGNQLPKITMYSLINKVFYENEAKDGFFNVETFIENERTAFLNSEKYAEIIENEDIYESTNYFVPSFSIGRIHLPSDNKAKFTRKTGNKTYINTLMKNRIIANNDPFQNILNISKIIKDNLDNLFPDYYVLVNLTTTTEENKFKEVYLQVKNIVSISISKNPKTKIKTAIINISTPNKNTFNFGDGAFSIKTMEEGTIKSYIIKPGNEIRIMLGYTFDDSYSIFNGMIASSQEIGNTTVITCVDFASTLHSVIPYNLDLNNETILAHDIKQEESNKETNNVAKKPENKPLTASEIEEANMTAGANLSDDKHEKNQYWQLVINKLSGINNPNGYLFEAFNSRLYQTYFQIGTSSFSVATILMMSQLRDNISKYFSNQFKETSLNRDTNMLALTLFNKENLTKAFGTFVNAEDVENVASIGNSLKNIYPIDIDYETYGYIEQDGTNKNTMSDVYLKNKNTNKVNNEKPFEYNPNNYSSNYIRQPLDFLSDQTAYGSFGSPRSNGTRRHVGVDYKNSPLMQKGRTNFVYCVANGKVFTNAYQEKGAGYYLIILHTGGLFATMYAHMQNKSSLKNGSDVYKGDVIGRVGDTGASQGKHLHFQVMLYKKHPMAKKIYEQIKSKGTTKKPLALEKSSSDLFYYLDPTLFFSTSNPYYISVFNDSISGNLNNKEDNVQPKTNIPKTMDKEYKDKLKKHIISNEGFKNNLYKDKDSQSIGYGFLKRGAGLNREIFSEEDYQKYFINKEYMNEEKANEILDKAINVYSRIPKKYLKNNWDKLDNNIKIALIDMNYQGWFYSLAQTTDFIDNISKGNLEEAIDTIENSNYYKQDKRRANKNIELIRSAL